MKATCVQSLVPYSQTSLKNQNPEELYDSRLVEGKSYVIYGLMIDEGKLFYLIHMFEDIFYPLIMPAKCFAEPTGSMPSNFVPSYHEDCQLTVVSSAMFRRSPYVYSELLDSEIGSPLDVEWQRFRRYVDAFEIVQSDDSEDLI